MTINTSSIDLYSGVTASSATGLLNDFRDAGLFGFHVGLSQIFFSADLRREELERCLSGRDLLSGSRVQWFPVELRHDLMLPPNTCSVCPEACVGSYGFLHPAPDGLIDCGVLQDRIISPEITLDDCVSVVSSEDGQSFFYFAVNPFNYPFSQSTRQIGGNQVKVITAWLHLATFEANYKRRFLSPLSQVSAQAPLAVHEAVMQCKSVPSVLSFLKLLGEVTQSPVCVTEGVVQSILLADEYRSATVVTSTGTYSGGKFVVPVVSVGQQVTSGDRLFDGFEIAELSYQRPEWDDHLRVPGSALGLSGVPYLDLTFDTMPVIVESTTRTTFDVGEYSDIYWDKLYAREEAMPTRLRSSLAGLSSVSPYDFFRKHRLLYGGVAVRLRGETLNESASVVPLLKQLIPPQRLLLLTITGQVPAELQKKLPPCCII